MRKDEKLKKNKSIDEKDALISFLQKTKDGEYAKIDATHLKYSRLKEETIIIEQDYYYSIS